MFQTPSREAQYELKQEQKKFARGWNKKKTHSRRPYDHMAHVDKGRICLSDSTYEADQESPIRKAQRDGHKRFYVKNGETCIKENGKYISLMDLYPNNKATP